MGLSNAAVMRLNYPTHMMFKSCKLIPVMIGSILILGKRYSVYDVLACLCMTVGLIFFTLADSQVQPEFDLLGKSMSFIDCITRHWCSQVFGWYVVHSLLMLWLEMSKKKLWKNTNQVIQKWYNKETSTTNVWLLLSFYILRSFSHMLLVRVTCWYSSWFLVLFLMHFYYGGRFVMTKRKLSFIE